MKGEIITGLPIITKFQFEGRTNEDLHRAKAESKRFKQEEEREKLQTNLALVETIILKTSNENIIFKN